MEEYHEEEVYQEDIIEKKTESDEISPEEGGFMMGYNEDWIKTNDNPFSLGAPRSKLFVLASE